MGMVGNETPIPRSRVTIKAIFERIRPRVDPLAGVYVTLNVVTISSEIRSPITRII